MMFLCSRTFIFVGGNGQLNRKRIGRLSQGLVSLMRKIKQGNITRECRQWGGERLVRKGFFEET